MTERRLTRTLLCRLGIGKAATLEVAGDAIAAAAPLGRIGRDDDMAGIAVFLASRAGAYLTGTIIPVDGGIATTATGTSN